MMSNSETAWTNARLKPGHHLYEGSDGIWRCALPGSRFLRLRGPRRSFLAAQQLLARPPGTTASAESLAGLGPLLRGLAQRGLLCDAEPPVVRSDSAVRTWTVRVDGTGPLADLVADRIEAASGGPVSAIVHRGRVDLADPDGLADVDVVVSTAEWLPDARWTRLQQRCAERGVLAWHRAHLDGAEVVLGPCWRPGHTASYTDTRARILAAAGAPDELRSLWVYLDTLDPLDTVDTRDAVGPSPSSWPGSGALATVAGLLVTDVLAVLRGDRLPGEGHQLRFDPATLAVHRHPVLPLPTADVHPDAQAVPLEDSRRRPHRPDHRGRA
ncbi:hypothetical protein BJF78_13530 [Pseudonocardia sp. CNS-139]|nr:hypothetical protein BJF78_13530 [Pseudonocardia sp. CNS-139]